MSNSKSIDSDIVEGSSIVNENSNNDSTSPTNSAISISGDILPFLSPAESEPKSSSTKPNTKNERYTEQDDLTLHTLGQLKLDSLKNSPPVDTTQLKRFLDDPTSVETPAASPYIFERNDSYISFLGPPDSRRRSIADSITNSMAIVKDVTVKHMKKRRFLIISIFSIICMLLFNLIFLPRTSLDRDLRRLRGELLTFDDCSRIFLTRLGFKNDIKNYLSMYEDELHSPGENYESTQSFFEEFENYVVSSEKYEVWMGKPIESKIKLIDKGKVIFNPPLQDTPLISFFPYSFNGSIEAKFTFVNYGRIIDYNLLLDKGINFKNTIFIIREDSIHPSLKIEEAENQGALAIIFYNDSYDDGKFTIANGYQEFPNGYARNHHSVDKFTSSYIFLQPGDPTTPGWSSTLFSKRVDPKTIPKIPVLPLSHDFITPVLKELNNLNQNLQWKGNIVDFEYNAGPSTAYLQIDNIVDFSIKPIHNVISTIPGIISDEEIIIGASRDIISGVGCASKGHLTLMEIAKGFNELLKHNWKPLRTIKLISWDGSSYGNLGSTEFGEYYGKSLSSNTIAYINLDGVKGTKLNIDTNPLFLNLLKETLKEIMFDDETSLKEFYQLNNGSFGIIGKSIGDYSVFQNHLGVPVVNIAFENNPHTDPVPYINSKYDSMKWMKKFDDELKLHNILAQYIGKFVINLSEREILQMKIYDYLDIIRTQFLNLKGKVPSHWLDRSIEVFSHGEDAHSVINTELDYITDILNDGISRAQEFDNNLDQLQNNITKDYPWFKLHKKIQTAIAIKLNNIKIRTLDRLFIGDSLFFNDANDDSTGLLKLRPWFKHLIFAPIISTTNTGVNILPGLKESLEDSNYELFARNLQALRISLERVTNKILK
ncbi:putative zinc metalloprotease [Martiniozyma asiatica (nom. inval.)]|nr:putative zinc metalloprotease [Martiniozyma asiatica]